MNDQNYSTTFSVDQTPEEAFAAINNVRGWWSEEIEGSTDKPNAEFKYHFEDVHRCTMKITEFIPNKKVVWLVLDNYFNFTKDKTEWKGTKITFDISKKGNKTEIHFSHLGLVPEYECYDVCSTAWGTYINGSLKSLITKGKGQPNANQRPRTGAEKNALGSRTQDQSYTIAITVKQTPEEAFAAINDVRGWWTGEPGVEGSTDKLGDEFTYRYEDIHYSKQRVTELIPGKKVAWLILDAKLNFVKDKSEWKGTKVVFDISKKGDKTEIRFTHQGLVPDYECYDSCSDAWGSYIKGGLRKLITTGKGQPNPKE